MTGKTTDLDKLRAEIDRLDDEIHDRLMRRATLAEEISSAKGEGPSLRPAREMEVLRRLAARHHGALPLASVIRIWREIIASTLALQSQYEVVALDAEAQPSLRDLARFHFGSVTPRRFVGTAAKVISACGESDRVIGLVPVPSPDADAPWWPHLVFASPAPVRIFARLPFLLDADGYDFPDTYAVGQVDVRPTGDDVTLAALRAEEGLSREAALGLLKDAGLSPSIAAVAPGEGGERLMLIQMDDFVGEGDPRLSMLTDDRLHEIRVLGGYARQIVHGGPRD